MSGSALRRLGALFVEPAGDEAQAAPRSGGRPAQVVGVIAPAEHLGAAAAGVATTLRHGASARTAVVCRPGEPPARRGGRRAASALARKLADRGLDARPSGALCHVALAQDARDAVREVWHVAAAADAPVVVALPGRLDGYDELLAQLDRLVLAAPASTDRAIVALALGSLAALGPSTSRTHPPAGPLGRRAAERGLLAIPLESPAEAPPAAEADTEHGGQAPAADVTRLAAAQAGARP